jgi:hypothetical protein
MGYSLIAGPQLTSSAQVGHALRNASECKLMRMTLEQFLQSLAKDAPDPELTAPLAALWWDAKGDWTRAHGLVDELTSREGMAVHAYLHRKEGAEWNANYWYTRSGRDFHRPSLDDEWKALVEGLL